jgi:hypothetical protein
MLALPSPTVTPPVLEDEGENSEALVSMVESPMAHGASLEPFFIGNLRSALQLHDNSTDFSQR